MEEKSYDLNSSKVRTVLLGYFVSFFILAFLDIVFLKPFSNGTFMINFIIVLILAAGISVLLFFIHKDIVIKICSGGVDYIKGDKVTHYSFADFEGTKVVRNYYNGIYTGTSRYLHFHDTEKNKTVTINCCSLKPEEFDELVAYMGKNEFEQAEKTEATERYFDNEKYFDINKEAIVSDFKSKKILTVAVTGIIAVILVVLLIVVLWEVSIAITIAVSGIIAIAAGFVIGLLLRSVSRFPAKVPSRITIDSHNIAIDGKTFDKEKVARIIMTPSSYDTKDRELFITMTDGTKLKYNFGRLNKAKPTVGTYPDYASLFSNIKLWCLQRNISFMASLS